MSWQSDKSATQCTLCNTHFSLIIRRHHCRVCGAIVCNTCSSFRKLPYGAEIVVEGGVDKARLGTEYRVCDGCEESGIDVIDGDASNHAHPSGSHVSHDLCPVCSLDLHNAFISLPLQDKLKLGLDVGLEGGLGVDDALNTLVLGGGVGFNVGVEEGGDFDDFGVARGEGVINGGSNLDDNIASGDDIINLNTTHRVSNSGVGRSDFGNVSNLGHKSESGNTDEVHDLPTESAELNRNNSGDSKMGALNISDNRDINELPNIGDLSINERAALELNKGMIKNLPVIDLPSGVDSTSGVIAKNDFLSTVEISEFTSTIVNKADELFSGIVKKVNKSFAGNLKKLSEYLPEELTNEYFSRDNKKASNLSNKTPGSFSGVTPGQFDSSDLIHTHSTPNCGQFGQSHHNTTDASHEFREDIFEQFKESHINSCLTNYDFNLLNHRLSPDNMAPRNKMLVYNIPPIPKPQYEYLKMSMTDSKDNGEETRYNNVLRNADSDGNEMNEVPLSQKVDNAGFKLNLDNTQVVGSIDTNSSINHDEKVDNYDHECIICLEDLNAGDKVGRLECLCVFHYKCIKDWFNKKGYGECPVHFLHK